MVKNFSLLLLIVILFSACAKVKVDKNKEQKIVKPALEVRHFLITPNEKTDACGLLKKLDTKTEIISASKFPAYVAFTVVDGDFLPKIETLGTLVSAFSGQGHLKNGFVLPLELVKWEKAVRRDGQAPKRDEKGTGISLRFEANKEEGDLVNLVTSIWYSSINGSVWASETGGLLAADSGLPKVLSNLPTEMSVGQTTLFAVVSEEDNFYSIISVALLLGKGKSLTPEAEKALNVPSK